MYKWIISYNDNTGYYIGGVYGIFSTFETAHNTVLSYVNKWKDSITAIETGKIFNFYSTNHGTWIIKRINN